VALEVSYHISQQVDCIINQASALRGATFHEKALLPFNFARTLTRTFDDSSFSITSIIIISIITSTQHTNCYQKFRAQPIPRWEHLSIPSLLHSNTTSQQGNSTAKIHSHNSFKSPLSFTTLPNCSTRIDFSLSKCYRRRFRRRNLPPH
jgi:hypothetical protein